MNNVPGVWGIDLGQCGLKAIRLEEIDGEITATAFDYVEHPKILSQPDADPDELIREALQKFLSRNTLRGDVVAISVPGQSGLARFVKLPPVEEKKIQDIVRFEAKQQIPFNLEEVVWDYQKIGSGVVTNGFAMETEIGLFAMKRDMVNRYLQHFKDVGVDVHIVQMSPLALCNYVAYDLLGKTPGEETGENGEKKCIVALDIGTDSSNLVITDGEKVIWQRPIPLGGNHFTRALTKDLKLTFAKAEHVKRNAMKSPDLKTILSALKPVLNDFVGEVQRSLGYFTNTHRDAQVEYMIGLGNAFRLPGLQRFLSEKLQLEVRKLGKMERLSGDGVTTSPIYTENILSFAVAYGLALQGIKRARLLTNLLPAEIRTERLVKAKKPWAVAAAAALLLTLFFSAVGMGLTYRTYNAAAVLDAEKAAEAKAKAAADAKKAFEDAKKKALDEEAAVRSVVAGQEERVNWLELLKFIGDSVPQPDGTNVAKTPLKAGEPAPFAQYLLAPPDQYRENKGQGMKGEEAYRKWLAKVKSGGFAATAVTDKPGEQRPVIDDLGPFIDDLVQFNIEAVDTRFCDDLAAYWTNVKTLVSPDHKDWVVPEEQYEKGPDGKGWVVEIRGYTFHTKKQRFVVDTFVRSLADRGDAAASTPAGDAAGAAGDAGKPAADTKQPAAPPTQPQLPAAETKPAGEAKPGEEAKPAGDQAGEDKSIVKKHISHVVLLQAVTRPTNDTTSFDLISGSSLDGLIGGSGGFGGPGMGGDTDRGGGMGGPGMAGPGPGAGAAPGPGAGGMGGPGMGDSGGASASPKSSWQPLGGGMQSGGMRGMAGGMAPGMAGPGMGGPGPGGRGGKFAGMGPGGPPGMMGGGRRLGGMGGSMPGSPDSPRGFGRGAAGGMGEGLRGDLMSTPDTKQIQHERTEFVILFIWREPTPSDALRGIEGDSGSAAPAAAAAPSTNSLGGSAPPVREK